MKRPKAAFLLNSGVYLADTMTLEGTHAEMACSRVDERDDHHPPTPKHSTPT